MKVQACEAAEFASSSLPARISSDRLLVGANGIMSALPSLFLAGAAAVLAGFVAQDPAALSLLTTAFTKLDPPTVYALVAFIAVVVLFLLTIGREGSKPVSMRCPATEWPTGKPSRTPAQAYPTYDVDDPKGSFSKVNTMLINEVIQELPWGYELPPGEVKWVKDMLDYNVCGGKMNRGLMVVECGKELLKASGKPVTNEMLCKFAVLGWCVEWLQAWLLVADDFMDDSQTRRGQKCWYLQPHVKKIALNDAFMIEMLVYKVSACARRPLPARPCCAACPGLRPSPGSTERATPRPRRLRPRTDHEASLRRRAVLPAAGRPDARDLVPDGVRPAARHAVHEPRPARLHAQPLDADRQVQDGVLLVLPARGDGHDRLRRAEQGRVRRGARHPDDHGHLLPGACTQRAARHTAAAAPTRAA